MASLRTVVVAMLMLSASLTAATAADAIALPVSNGAAQVPVYDDGGFDWSGFYAGIYGVAQSSPVGGTQYGIGIDAGVNAQFDFFLVGGEVALQGLTGGTLDTAYGQVLGKAGLVITDAVLIYAAAGYGVDLGPAAEDDILLGGGVELAVADDWTVRAQYLHGFAVSGANPKDQVTLGAHFHF